MMSCLWLCLSLLCAATFLQSSAWSHEVVSVMCNKTANVVAAQTVTLNCTIDTENCTGVRYHWNNAQGDIQCSNSWKYRCEWDRLTYVSLTISNVTEEENYTIRIQTDCGVTKPSTTEVQVIKSSSIASEGGKQDETETMPILLPILGIVIALAVIALGVLYLTRKRLQETTLTKDTGQRSGELLTV
ncbi:hypothetical protein ABVT39_010543 [Epinephelus coioides]